MDNINSVIRFDLHIHSKASIYKESGGIVDNSTRENLPLLLSKLNESNIALFSITDHNRLDVQLYLEAIRLLDQDSKKYPNVKNILAGVEFDVQIDKNKECCHIITIFDVQNDKLKFEKIATAIEKNKLDKPDDFYSKNNFENLLKTIGLNTILIAEQRKSLSNSNGKHKSLSDSAVSPNEILRTGFIDALEFQKPKVEGILINNLKEINLPIPLFSGSDCHDWEFYPYHDKDNQNLEFEHSCAKMLPTFKGLLMAITAPETRFNRDAYSVAPIKSLRINDKEVSLVNGINVIIGENGSGKTTLLELISGFKTKKYIEKIQGDNNIMINTRGEDYQKKYVKQGEIIENFYANNLFKDSGEDNYKNIDTTQFNSIYKAFAKELKDAIEFNIAYNQLEQSRKEISIEYREISKQQGYYIVINGDIEEEDNNIHEDKYIKFKNLLRLINDISKDSYFSKYLKWLDESILLLKKIHKEIKEIYEKQKYLLAVQNVFNGSISDYCEKISCESSTKDKEYQKYTRMRTDFINKVVSSIKKATESNKWPTFPAKLKGVTQVKKQGFNFNTEASYNNKNMEDDFLLKMFTAEYRSWKKLKQIRTEDAFVDAIYRCANATDIKQSYNYNLNNFIETAIKCNQFISNDDGNEKIGNTLGEMSLAFYKYYTKDTYSWSTFMVDQPEDNISNNNIRKNLIKYFNNIRENKQLIFVTHNPLLVVNLDVDNVIYVENHNGILSIKNGCLEYEDENSNILNLIAECMDGGKETIERRLKVYGKSY